MEQTQVPTQKPLYKTPMGILVILAFLPFALTYWIWKRDWILWQRIGAIALLWFILFAVGNLGEKGGFKALQSGRKAEKQVGSTIPSTPFPTSTPIPTTEATPKPTEKPIPTSTLDPYEIMSKIGKDVAGDNSNVSVFKNKDGSIDIINNIQLTPEVTWGMDVYAKKWATGFISKSYNSELNIRYVLVTVSFFHTGRPATRVGLGIKQAKNFSKDDWDSLGSTGLCYVLARIQIGDDIDPDDPSFDPSNWAFARNCD